MNFFKFFPQTSYTFGNQSTNDTFRNISIYADTIDQVKDNLTMYENYNVLDGERPDIVSQKLYDSPEFHWTFYFLNDHVKERGWPLTQKQLFSLASKRFPNRVLRLNIDISTILKVGQILSGTINGATAKIVHRDTDNLQLTLSEISQGFNTTQGYQVTNADGTITTIAPNNLISLVDEVNAIHHYENASGEVIDLVDSNGAFVEGANHIKITNLEHYIRANDELKKIRVFRPGSIIQIADAFKRAVRS